ncbi:hypothetical protein H4582DRAFT_2062288 [Lactarius indigo]|nr:hypothetical protein H4582DRAFT_2062288 [Lactarius indigo]
MEHPPRDSLFRVVKAKPSVYMAPLDGTAIGTSISIDEYLQERRIREAFDGPLTDYEYSGEDSEGEPAFSRQQQRAPCPPAVPCAVPPAKGPPSRAQRERERNKNRRRNRRAKQAGEGSDEGLKHVVKKRRMEAAAESLQLPFSVRADAEVTKPGWVGKRNACMPMQAYTKEELTGQHGMAYFPWDGRQSHPLLDREKRIIGVLVGQPRSQSSWENAKSGAFAALRAAAGLMTFMDKELTNRRGAFPCVSHGISFGNGQKEPRYLRHLEPNRTVLEGIMGDPSIQRICNFGSSAFKIYGAKNYRYMKATVEALRASRDSCSDEKLKLRRPYDSKVGVFPCRSFNLGEQSVSFPHTDNANLAQAWCSITPLGSFDPKWGGHLVLWDFKLVIEFPPGSTVLIPSALIKHSNTPVQTGETRFCIVQYAAGGLFRWVENGFRSDEDRRASSSEEQLQAYISEQGARWAKAAGMYTTLDELRCPQEPPEVAVGEGSLTSKGGQ